MTTIGKFIDAKLTQYNRTQDKSNAAGLRGLADLIENISAAIRSAADCDRQAVESLPIREKKRSSAAVTAKYAPLYDAVCAARRELHNFAARQSDFNATEFASAADAAAELLRRNGVDPGE